MFGQVQSWLIKGSVVAEVQQPLASATVTLVNTDNKEVLKTTTGNDGHFNLSYSVKGNYTLSISHTGYKEFRSPIFELTDKDFGVITLSASADTLNEVTVQSKQNLIELSGNTLVYNVSKSIDAQGASAFEALKKAPGIYVDNETVITLNGKQGPLILLDGKQTYLSGRR